MPAMVMNAPPSGAGVGGNTTTTTTADPHAHTTNTTSGRHTQHHGNNHLAMLNKPLPLRRRRSKGTIAGFASSSPGSNSNDHLENDSVGGGHNDSKGNEHHHQPQHETPKGAGERGAGVGASGITSPPPKPNHSARLALLCVENAVQMGARTQLNLCPPGKAREELLKTLQLRRKKKKLAPQPIRRSMSIGRSPSITSVGSRVSAQEETTMFDRIMGETGVNEYDAAEEEYLNSPNTPVRDLNSDGEEIEEEESSGDEDPLDVKFDDEEMDMEDDGALREKPREALYTLTEGSANGTSTGKLAFNLRKVKWFDAVTASDRASARQFLRKEISNLRKKDLVNLTKHLKRVQAKEKRRREMESRRLNRLDSGNYSDEEDEDLLNQSMHGGQGLSKLPNNMTPSLSAAFVMESFSITPKESLEGMSKCYEGFVAAGTVLLDAERDDPASATADNDNNNGEEKKKPTRTEIMSALAPLIITSLEKESGETILALAKLRKLCGTKRYQRRFVQRIAPSLVRPPNAAMWCLRHRNDMEAILVAVELILDSAFDLFSSGWHERGRTLLADSKRAKTLEAAANQLKRLSSQLPSDSSMIGHKRTGSLLLGGTSGKDTSNSGMAEWEVLAVDVQIKCSIENLFTNDWTRVSIPNAPLRDGESYTNHRTKSRGITGNKSKALPSSDSSHTDTGSQSSVEHTPPVASPPRISHGKNANHVSAIGVGKTQGVSNFDSVFNNANAANSPTFVQVGQESLDTPESRVSDPSSPPQTPNPYSNNTQTNTPPRTSPDNSGMAGLSASMQSPTKKKITPPLAHQPHFDFNQGPTMNVNPESPRTGLTPAPLSPSKTQRKEAAHQRFTTSNSPQSNAQNTYLRALTSTAKERKHTVAACRALRAQINRFEEAFAHFHGRPPKGPQERAPLATTYTQYREWKRAIRADAASRIQALFRGARVRWWFIRNGNNRIKEVVKKRAGRPKQLTEAPTTPTRSSHANRSGVGNVRTGNSAVEVSYFPEEPGGSDNVQTQNWNGRGKPMRVSRGQSNESAGISLPALSSGDASPLSQRSRPDTSHSSTGSVAIYNDLTLPELQAKKRELKKQLKAYDMNFFNKHRRMPVKAEKEPIRHLYERYNSLKNRITAVERDPSLINSSASMNSSIVYDGSTSHSLALSSPSQRSMQSSLSNSTDNSSYIDGSPPIPTVDKMPPSIEKNPQRRSPSSSSQTPGNRVTQSGSPTQDLASLKAEKQQLHQMLRSYEKDFLKMHNRQVSCFSDIRPVASQYRRYKEIKKSILALQQAPGEK